MGVKCVIKFDDNESGVFYGGQNLKGTVQLTLGSAQKFRALRLSVNGSASCKWSEKVRKTSGFSLFGQRMSRRTKPAYYFARISFHGKDLYLNNEYYLFGNDIGDSIEYAAGIHSFNFACLLPPGLPSNIEGRYGHIRYNLEAVLDIPWALDKSFKAPFTVVKEENLNSWPHLQVPREKHMKKKFCCFPFICGRGSLLIQATIPVAGFIPGETIPVEIDIKNLSSIPIAYTTVALIRSVEFICDEPYLRSKVEKDKTISVAKGPGFPSTNSGKVSTAVIVPMTVCSNAHCSRLIKVSYRLEITCKVRGFHFSPKLTIPVTIGNVPFAANSLLYDAAIFAASAPSAPIAPLNDLPPSFAAATGQYDKSIEAGQPQQLNAGWMKSSNSVNAPSAPEF